MAYYLDLKVKQKAIQCFSFNSWFWSSAIDQFSRQNKTEEQKIP